MKKPLAKFKVAALLAVISFALSGCALTDALTGSNSVYNSSIGDLNERISCPVGGVETPATGSYTVPTTRWNQNDIIDVAFSSAGNPQPSSTNTFKYFRIDQEAKIPASKLEPGIEAYVDRQFRGNGFVIEDTEENKVQDTMFVPLVTRSRQLMTNIITPASQNTSVARWPRASQSEIYTMNRSKYFGDRLSDFNYYSSQGKELFQWSNIPAVIFVLFNPTEKYAQLTPAERQARVPEDLTSRVMRFDVYYSVAKYNSLYDRKTCKLKSNLSLDPPQQFTYCRSNTPFQSASATTSEADRTIRFASTPLSKLSRCLGTGIAYAADSQSSDLPPVPSFRKTSLLGRAVTRIRSWFGVSASTSSYSTEENTLRIWMVQNTQTYKQNWVDLDQVTKESLVAWAFRNKIDSDIRLWYSSTQFNRSLYDGTWLREMRSEQTPPSGIYEPSNAPGNTNTSGNLPGSSTTVATNADGTATGLPDPAATAPPAGDVAKTKESNSGVVMDSPRLHREAVKTCQQKCDQGVGLKEFIEEHNPINIELNEKKVDGSFCNGKEKVAPYCRDKKEDRLCWAPNPDCKQANFGCTLPDATENNDENKSCGGEFKGRAHDCDISPTQASCPAEDILGHNIPRDMWFTWMVADRGGLQAFTKPEITQDKVSDLFKLAFINLATKTFTKLTSIDLSQWVPVLMDSLGWSKHMGLTVKPGTKLYSLEAYQRNADILGPQRVGCFHDSSLYNNGAPDLVAMEKCAFAHAEYTVSWGDIQQFGASYRGDSGGGTLSELGNGLGNADQIDFKKLQEQFQQLTQHFQQLAQQFQQLSQQFQDVSKSLQDVANQAQQQATNNQNQQNMVPGARPGGRMAADPSSLTLDLRNSREGRVTIRGGQAPYTVTNLSGIATYAHSNNSNDFDPTLVFTAQAPGQTLAKVQDASGDYYNIRISVRDANGNVPTSSAANNGFANPPSGLEGAHPVASLNPTNEQWNYCYYTPE